MPVADARPVPRKNAAFRHYFAIRKNDGTLITTWAGMDSEVSLDGAAFADCTSEATEIGTSGCGFLDLTAAEMNADAVLLKITVTNTGGLPLVFTLYPEEAGDYRCDAVMISGDAAAADNFETMLDGTGGQTLSLGSLVVSNSTGTAVTLESTGSNGRGLMVSGNGTGAGAQVNAGATGIGLDINGGATSGAGATVDSTSGGALQVTAGGGNGDGVLVAGNGSGAGIRSNAGATGIGLDINGGATSGAGATVDSTTDDALIVTSAAGNGDAISLVPHGTGFGLNSTLSALRQPLKNVAFSNIEFSMFDSTDHVTPKTGLTITGERSIDGGAFVAVSGAIAEVGSGVYQFDAAAADMNGTVITFKFTAAAADQQALTVVTAG